jgi:hypothetical protein
MERWRVWTTMMMMTVIGQMNSALPRATFHFTRRQRRRLKLIPERRLVFGAAG